MAFFPDGKLPDIVYDGMVDEKKTVDGKLPEGKQIFIGDNGDFTFANIDYPKLMSGQPPELDFKLEAYSTELPKLPPVTIPGVK